MTQFNGVRTLLVSLILVILLAVCLAPAVTYAQEEWVQVKTFTGKGDKTTAPFHISGAKWRITWTADAEHPDFAVFGFFVYPEGETVMFVESIMHSGGSGSDTTYIYEGKDNFYIAVSAANLRSWTIEVENCITKAPPAKEPSPPPTSPAPEPKKEDDGCFIATAAYGTPAAQEIDILREFRDEVLLNSVPGTKLVHLYYTTSPPIAELISEHNALKTLVKELLVDPVVIVLEHSESLWSE